MLKRTAVMFVILLFVLLLSWDARNIPGAIVHGGYGIVDRYGQLQVVQGKLCDERGQPVQLRGMSTMGLQWFSYSPKTVFNLVNDWGISVFRIAMYTKEGGFIDNPSIKSRVKRLVEEAIRQGVYVIIDWHILSDNDPNTYKKQAKKFFAEMATLYGKYPHVIYEICNEPNGGYVTWDRQIKPYAEEVIQVIREIDPDNIIVVGTDMWSQGVVAAAENPLDGSNLMYALHFYAGTHAKSLRDAADLALSKGIALFVTEWGTSSATGGGGVYFDEAQRWVDWMAERQISWVNWSLCNKSESSAALLPSANVEGPWKESHLSPSGKWVRERIIGK